VRRALGRKEYKVNISLLQSDYAVQIRLHMLPLLTNKEPVVLDLIAHMSELFDTAVYKLITVSYFRN
jgi:hypothetical protein